MSASTILTAVGVIAALLAALATMDYARFQREPNVSVYFESEGNWIFLVIQNTGTDTARNIQFSHDLSKEELADIFGPNAHGQRYIVYQDLTFLRYYTYLAPHQRIRHQWLFKPFVLRDKKPRPFTFSVSYHDKWGLAHETKAPFDGAMFGTWETAYDPKPAPEELIEKRLVEIQNELKSLNRREDALHRRRLIREGEIERAEWMQEAESLRGKPDNQ